jgi:hypothetical protein
MSRLAMVGVWLFAFAYTAYAVGVIFAALAVLGAAVGAPVGFVLAVGPLIVGSIWVVVGR